MSQWDPALYQSSHSFVWERGRGLVELLAPQVGCTSPIGLPLVFMHDWTKTWPFGWNVIFHASTVATSSTTRVRRSSSRRRSTPTPTAPSCERA